MDIVVTPENVPQIVQALYENVKSNQHRVDEMEPVITKMAKQTDRIDGIIYRNGFAAAIKEQAKDLKEFREDFSEFEKSREDSCPMARKAAVEEEQHDKKRDWHTTLIRVVGTVIGSVSTLIIIIEKIIQ